MGYATGIHYNALFATGIVLLTVIIILLLIANYYQLQKESNYWRRISMIHWTEPKNHRSNEFIYRGYVY